MPHFEVEAMFGFRLAFVRVLSALQFDYSAEFIELTFSPRIAATAILALTFVSVFAISIFIQSLVQP